MPADTAAIIRLEGVTKTYEGARVLDGITLGLEAGRAHTLVGPSGIGKTTLLRIIAGMTPPDAGAVVVDGLRVDDRRLDRVAFHKKLGVTFQTFNLFPHRRVLDNITLAPRRVLRQSRQQAESRGMALLNLFGLGEKARAFPGELSAGERQRVAIARTLAMDPEIVIFDEITSALDPRMMYSIAAMIRGLVDNGRTCLIASHDMAFVRAVSDIVYYLDEGVIIEQAPVDAFFERPVDPRTNTFLGGASLPDAAAATG